MTILEHMGNSTFNRLYAISRPEGSLSNPGIGIAGIVLKFEKINPLYPSSAIPHFSILLFGNNNSYNEN